MRFLAFTLLASALLFNTAAANPLQARCTDLGRACTTNNCCHGHCYGGVSFSLFEQVAQVIAGCMWADARWVV